MTSLRTARHSRISRSGFQGLTVVFMMFRRWWYEALHQEQDKLAVLVLGGSKFMGKAQVVVSVVSSAKHNEIQRFCRGVCGDDSAPCPSHDSD